MVWFFVSFKVGQPETGVNFANETWILLGEKMKINNAEKSNAIKKKKFF